MSAAPDPPADHHRIGLVLHPSNDAAAEVDVVTSWVPWGARRTSAICSGRPPCSWGSTSQGRWSATSMRELQDRIPVSLTD